MANSDSDYYSIEPFNYENCIVNRLDNSDSAMDSDSSSSALSHNNKSIQERPVLMDPVEDDVNTQDEPELDLKDCFVLMVGLMNRVERYLEKQIEDADQEALLNQVVVIRSLMMNNHRQFGIDDFKTLNRNRQKQDEESQTQEAPENQEPKSKFINQNGQQTPAEKDQIFKTPKNKHLTRLSNPSASSVSKIPNSSKKRSESAEVTMKRFPTRSEHAKKRITDRMLDIQLKLRKACETMHSAEPKKRVKRLRKKQSKSLSDKSTTSIKRKLYNEGSWLDHLSTTINYNG